MTDGEPLMNGNSGVPRLGVPRIGFGESLHGYLQNCLPTRSTDSTKGFPHALLLSGTFNRALWNAIIGEEGRATFRVRNRTTHLMTWALGINRDPRWGRG